MWHAFVELIRAGIFAAAQVCGGSIGGGVLAVSLTLRLGLLPLTLRMARRARAQQAVLAGLKPELDRLRRRYEKNPARLLEETQAVYRRHGIRMFAPSSMLGLALQMPLLSGLFAAVRSGLGQRVRFLWIADLAGRNLALVLIVAALSGVAAALTPNPAAQQGLVVGMSALAALVTVGVLWSASSAVVLSVGAGSAVGVLQSILLARDARRKPAA
jgi:YidC/Oxa1 family membrane protein insertase